LVHQGEVLHNFRPQSSVLPDILAENSKNLTAFCTEWNLFQYTRVPFGLAIGAQVLTELLDQVFQDFKFDFVYHYLDVVVIYNEDFDSHIEHIRLVLERLR
jgi:hypothetical protein